MSYVLMLVQVIGNEYMRHGFQNKVVFAHRCVSGAFKR